MDNVISNIQTSLHEVHGRFETSGLNLTSLTSRVNALESGIDEDFSGQLLLKADKNEVAKFTSNSNVVTQYSVTQLGEKINSLEISDNNLQSSKVSKTRVSVHLDGDGTDVPSYTLSQEGLGSKLKDMDNEIGLRAMTSRVASFTKDGILTNLSKDELGARLIAIESDVTTRALKSEVSTHTDSENVTTTYSVASLGAELHRITNIVDSLDSYVLKSEVSRLEVNGSTLPEYTLSQLELGAKLKEIVESISNFVVSSQVSKNNDPGTTNYALNAYTLSDYELGSMLERFDTTHLIKSQVSKRYAVNNDGTISGNLDNNYTLSDFDLGTKLFNIDTTLSTKVTGDEVSINTTDSAYTLSQTELGTMLKTLTGRIDLVSPDDADSSVFALKTSVSTNVDNVAYTLSTTALATKLESIDTLLDTHGTLINSKASISDMADRALQSMVSLKYVNDDGITVDDKFTCGVMELGSLLYDMNEATETIARDYVTDAELNNAVGNAVLASGALTAATFLSTGVATVTSGGSSVVKTAADLAKAVFGGGGDDDEDPPPPIFIQRSEGIFRPGNWGSSFSNNEGYSRPMTEGRENHFASDTYAHDLHHYVINLIAGNAKVFYRDVSYTSKVRLLGSSGSAENMAAQYGPPASTSFMFPPPASLLLVEADLSWGSSTNRTQRDGTTLSGYTSGTHALSCFGTSRFEGRSESRKVVWLTGSGTTALSALDAKLAFDGTGGDAPIHIFGESATKYGLDLHDAGLVMRNSDVNSKIDVSYNSYNLVFSSVSSDEVSTSILTLNSEANSVGIAGGASSQYKLYVHGGANFTSGITSPTALMTGNNSAIPSLTISNTTVGAKKEFKMLTDQNGFKIKYGTATSGVVVMDTRLSISDTFTTVDSIGVDSGLEIVGKLGSKASLVLRNLPNANMNAGPVTLGRYVSLKNESNSTKMYMGYTSALKSEVIDFSDNSVTVKSRSSRPGLMSSGNDTNQAGIGLINTETPTSLEAAIRLGSTLSIGIGSRQVGAETTLSNVMELSPATDSVSGNVLMLNNAERYGITTDATVVKGSLHVTGDINLLDISTTPPTSTNLASSVNTSSAQMTTLINGGFLNMTNSSGATVSVRAADIASIGHPGYDITDENGTVTSHSRTGLFLNLDSSQSTDLFETLMVSKGFIQGPNEANPGVSKVYDIDEVDNLFVKGAVAGSVSSITIAQATQGSTTFPTATFSGSGNPFITLPVINTVTAGVFRVVVSNGGSNYVVGDTITMSNSFGTGSNAIFTVVTESGGAITAGPSSLTITNPGAYTSLSGGVTNMTQQSTDGSGSGVTFSVELSVISVSMSSIGLGYVYPPTLTLAGTSLSQSATTTIYTSSSPTLLDGRLATTKTEMTVSTASQLNTALSGYTNTAGLNTIFQDFYTITESDEAYAPIAATGETYAYLSTTSLQNYQTTAASNILYQPKEVANDVYIKASDLTASGTGFYDKTTSDGKYQLKPASGQSFALASSIVGLIGSSTTSLTNYYTKSDSDGRFQPLPSTGETYALTSDLADFITDGTSTLTHYSTTNASNALYQQKEDPNDHYALISDLSTFITNSTNALSNYSTTSAANDLYQAKEGSDPYAHMSDIPASSSHWIKNASNNKLTYSAANVGIGTTSPTGSLEIHSSAAGNLGVASPNTQLVLGCTHTTAADDGDRGAGVMFTQRWNNPSTSLVAVGGIYGKKTNNSGSYGGGLSFCYGPDGLNNLTEGMCIRSNGLVGIGRSAPENAKLEVQATSEDIFRGYDGAVMRIRLQRSGTSYFSGAFGIGEGTPQAKLHVAGSGSGTLGSARRGYFRFNDHSGRTWTDNTGSWGNLGIYASTHIGTNHYFVSHGGFFGASDIRIKKEISDIDDAEALRVLRLLKPKQYGYVDSLSRGEGSVWGFIAQEVKEVLPSAIRTRTEYIPNIFMLAKVVETNIIQFTTFDTNNLVGNTNKLRILDKDEEEKFVTIAEIIDDSSIRVIEDLTEWTYESEDKTCSEIFVYGEQVNDFIFIKKESIFTATTAALQEVDRQLQAEISRNDELEKRLLAIESRIGIVDT